MFLETVYVYLILTTDKGPLTLRKRPELIKNVNLKPLLRVFEIIDMLPTDRIAKEYIVELIGKFGLLPNDALIAATCKHYEDFRQVDFLEVVEP
ncbi:PIN domain-containing protein [Archaeoglobus fulgidus]|uniref:Putative nucleic acid-binding protein n=2 Tax=Archaeoglobus fulgidus TaxID=2234 RepID=A0A075WC74_ARCFL|nr:PIN domain-containing protein [Archaeoglobus fulgidus]AIG97142.1 putative nucleic acid-binding protein [Archaeoglobus fulgidus DSM 8774]